MKYKGMSEYLCKSTTRFRKYNKMNTNGEVMVMMMMNPPMIFVAAWMMPGCKFPCRSLPEVRFLPFLVSLEI